MPKHLPLSLLGLNVSGDLGPWTIYTDRYGKKIAFPISPPKEPPTNPQLWQRNRFRAAQALWSVLDDGAKASLEEACRRLSFAFTGQNLFISCLLRSDWTGYRTVAAQSGLVLPPLPTMSPWRATP